MNATDPACAGFADPIHDAQQAFRHLLDALARPGRPVALGAPIPGLALGAAMSHLLLTLSDADTAVWWQRPDDDALPRWLRFHTGAPHTGRTDLAAFGVIVAGLDTPRLDTFATGSAAAPERSTSLLIELPSLDSGPALEWRGPGIDGVCKVRLDGLPADFWRQWQGNHAGFPCGVDVVFTCGTAAVGLPRTTRVRRLEGV